MKKLSLFLLFILGLQYAYACTSAVISASRTATGEVILWKNRDNSTRRTKVAFISGGKYSYTGLFNSSGSCYGGLNSKGFAYVSNTVSNLPVEENGVTSNPYSGALGTQGLANCATVDEFEALIKKLVPRKDGFQGMLGTCDAQGGAAWFEITQNGYTRYDAKDTKEGYVLRSNFGFSGDASNRGTSVRRYNLMSRRLSEHKDPFTVQDFVDYSRSFYTLSQGDILENDKQYIDESYTVNRYTTCAEFIIVSGKNPRIFFINGNPLAGMALPVFVGGIIPTCLTLDGLMYTTSEAYLAKAYTQNSSGKYVMNKDVVRKVSKCTYEVYDPVEKPTDSKTLSAKLDADYKIQSNKVMAMLNGTVGDIDAGGAVNIGDVTSLINMVMNEYTTLSYEFYAGDMNSDGSLNIGDVTALIEKVMSGSSKALKPEE